MYASQLFRVADLVRLMARIVRSFTGAGPPFSGKSSRLDAASLALEQTAFDLAGIAGDMKRCRQPVQ